MGGFGGGQQAQAPKLDVGASLRLSPGQIDQLIRNTPAMARVLGDTSLREQSQNTLYGLGMLVDPAATLGQSMIDEAAQDRRSRIDSLNRQLRDGKISRRQFNAQKSAADNTYNEAATKARSINPLGDLQRTFAQEFGERDNLIGAMRGALGSTDEYNRLQGNLADGGELGRRLMGEAMSRSERGFGQLSAEAERDATQAARSGMAARGMATGSAGLGAELLNRDRFQRQRAAEDINFVSGVKADEQSRFTTSAQLSDAERARQLGTQQDIYNFSLSSNPRMMLAGLGSPYANMTQPAFGQLGNITGSVQPQYSGGQFSSGGMGGALMGGGMGAVSGAMAGAPLGPWGIAGGAVLGGLTGAIGGSR